MSLHFKGLNVFSIPQGFHKVLVLLVSFYFWHSAASRTR